MRGRHFLPLLLWSALIAACGEERRDLGIYSGRDKQFLDRLVTNFESKTGLSVAGGRVHAGGSELLRRLAEEGEDTPCDVFITNDSATLEGARAQGLLAKLPSVLSDKVESRYRAGDETWVGISARLRVIVVNVDQVKDGEIRSVFDLADSRWKGKVGSCGVTNESFVSGIATMLADFGEERTRSFLQGLKENLRKTYQKHTPIVEDVAKGELALGFVNHYYYYRHKEKDSASAAAIVFPDQDGPGVAWNVAGAALTKYAPSPENGIRFMEYLLSAEGQRIFSEANFEYPVVPGAPLHPAVAPLSEIKISGVGIDEIGRRRRSAVELLREIGFD